MDDFDDLIEDGLGLQEDEEDYEDQFGTLQLVDPNPLPLHHFPTPLEPTLPPQPLIEPSSPHTTTAIFHRSSPHTSALRVRRMPESSHLLMACSGALPCLYL